MEKLGNYLHTGLEIRYTGYVQIANMEGIGGENNGGKGNRSQCWGEEQESSQ